MLKIPFILEKQLNKILKPQLSTIVELKIDNKLKKRFYGKSLTATFLQYMYSNFAQASTNFVASTSPFSDNTNIKATSGINYNVFDRVWTLNAPINNSSWGIMLGIGTTPPTPSDYKLETLINSGTAGGQLNFYQQTAVQGVVVSGSVSSFVLQRVAVNNSGADITINEVGIGINEAGIIALIFRDIISGGLLVPNTSTVTITITFSITT